ncbi:cytochrome p450 [Holotrichia oblita]|uniref:Cytochrome p450 n=1 Tax=Holotrichia oblita TaxID=644536 RepID=A0ACB9TB76_HOLOL|nr:cytochrome p450 [Holotrichia oblita]
MLVIADDEYCKNLQTNESKNQIETPKMIFWILLVIAAFALWKLSRHYNYWTDLGIKQRKQVYLLGDNATVFLRRESFFDLFRRLYDTFPNERYFGIYQGTLPTLIIKDPEIIKQVTVKEFDHFLNHRAFVPDGVDPLWSKNLVALKDTEWREMRSTLSPSITSSKMKVIFSLMTDCADEYVKYFLKQKKIVEIELKDTTTRYTNDVIATVAFGVKCDSINEQNNEFYRMGKKTTTFTFARSLIFILYSMVPQVCKALKIRLFPREIYDFFVNLTKDTIKARETHGIVRPDMINLLLEARKGKKIEDSSNGIIDTGFATVQESSIHTNAAKPKQELTDIDIAAQAMIFFFAGFDSVSTLMYFMAYEMVVNPDVQKRLQEEIDDTLKECNGKLTYEALLKMKYMDMVICETLRKWPAAIGTDRVCSKPFTIEAVNPGEKPVHLKPGDVIFVPINGIHRDPKYFPNPDRFDPERFSDENKGNIQPYTYMPFGLGPRNCIGSRFAILETKTLFFFMLSKLNFIPINKTEIPIKLSRKNFSIVAENGMWIGRFNFKFQNQIETPKMIFWILLVIAAFALWKLSRHYNYWTDLGIKQRKQVYLLGDNATVFLRQESFFDLFRRLYDTFPNERYFGIYQGTLPTLIIKDPEIIKQVTVKEFDHFLNHRAFVPDGVDPLWSKNLFALQDTEWREMRSTLSPSFTSSKMKVIFSLMTECADEYVKYFLKQKKTVEIELKDTTTRYTNDVIATVAFGVKCDSINEQNNEFYRMGKKTTTFTFARNLIFLLYTMFPQLCKTLKISLFPSDIYDFFVNLTKDTIKARETHGIVRPDMLNLLLEARKGKKIEDSSNGVIDTGFATVEESSIHTNAAKPKQELTDMDIAAQAMIFFFAGFDSVSTLLCFMAYELVVNPDVQKRLQEEIDDTLKECNGKLTYEALLKMKYMDMVICETLRKWPAAVGTDRVCSKPFTIEAVNPGEKPVHLKPGDIVFIPINGIHRDPKYYTNPDTFDPERFSDENKGTIEPYTYMPFGLGPRNCIGSRFAILESKTIFFSMLSKFNFVAIDKTQIPIKLSKKSFNIIGENGMWVGLEPRSK